MSLRMQDWRWRIEGTCGNSHFFKKKTDVWGIAGHLRIGLGESEAVVGEKNRRTKLIWGGSSPETGENAPLASRSFRFGVRSVELDRTSLTSEKGRENSVSLWIHKKKFSSLEQTGFRWVLPHPEEKIKSNRLWTWCWIWIVIWSAAGAEAITNRMSFMKSAMKKEFLYGRILWKHAEDILSRKNFWKSWKRSDVPCAKAPSASVPCAVVRRQWKWYSDSLGNEWKVDQTATVIHGWLSRKYFVWMIMSENIFPSSPYIDEVAFKNHAGDSRIPEQHLWGPRDYYKGDFYKNAIAHFASETGYHGCPFCEIHPKIYFRKSTMAVPAEWRMAASCIQSDGENGGNRMHTGLSWWQVRFGCFFGCEAKDLKSFLSWARFQAEAKNILLNVFGLENGRERGIIWWNVLDGCPQFSDAVVDYYFDKKTGLWLHQAFSGKSRLLCDEPEENGNIHLMASNDLPDRRKDSLLCDRCHLWCGGSRRRCLPSSRFLCGNCFAWQ